MLENKNLNEPQNPQLNIAAVIRSYSDKGIFIEVLADGYKLEGVGICWRGYVYWKENGEWIEEDCGCFPDKRYDYSGLFLEVKKRWNKTEKEERRMGDTAYKGAGGDVRRTA
jgi:hypothetical protein